MPLILSALLLAQAAQPAPGADPAPAKPEKPVCRFYQTTGTIMRGKRQCHTRAEWARIDAGQQGSMQHLQDSVTNGGRSGY